jgi:NAD(P) transhydrogenase
MKEVDLLVIGSGPAGQRAAIQGVKLGKKVALIEKREVLGGVCANIGTIPSKTLREAIMYLSGYRERGVYGRSYSLKENITYQDLRKRVDHVVKHEVEVARDRLTRTGVEIIQGHASFEGPHEMVVQNEEQIRHIKAENIIVATGSTPYRASRVPFDNQQVIDSDTMWEPGYEMGELPKSILFIGAGVIGTEYACMFAALGVDVRLLDRRLELFRFVDTELNDALLYHMRNEKITLYLGKDFTDIHVDDSGKVVTKLENGRDIKTDMLMFCSGRSGATESLNLEAAGVEIGNRELLKVNEQLQTNVPHIYAAGDVIGFPALASTSMEQGRQAACNALGIPFHVDAGLMPYGIYTIPEISMVGKTEQELAEDGVPYDIGIGRFREVSRGIISGDETGMLKLVFHQKTGQLLGVHIMGDSASELLHIGQAVMSYGGSISYFVDTVFNYPTLAEAYKIAALNGLKRVGERAIAQEEFLSPKDELDKS